MSESLPSLIESGFQLGFVLLFTFWGLTVPLRWFFRAVGL